METGACSWKNLTQHLSHTKTADIWLRVVSESKGSKNAPKEKRQFYFYKTWNKSKEKK